MQYQIFSYLDLPSHLNIRKVCRQWNQMIIEQEKMYSTFVIKIDHQNGSDPALSSLVGWQNLRVVGLQNKVSVNANFIKTLLKIETFRKIEFKECGIWWTYLLHKFAGHPTWTDLVIYDCFAVKESKRQCPYKISSNSEKRLTCRLKRSNMNAFMDSINYVELQLMSLNVQKPLNGKCPQLNMAKYRESLHLLIQRCRFSLKELNVYTEGLQGCHNLAEYFNDMPLEKLRLPVLNDPIFATDDCLAKKLDLKEVILPKLMKSNLRSYAPFLKSIVEKIPKTVTVVRMESVEYMIPGFFEAFPSLTKFHCCFSLKEYLSGDPCPSMRSLWCNMLDINDRNQVKVRFPGLTEFEWNHRKFM